MARGRGRFRLFVYRRASMKTTAADLSTTTGAYNLQMIEAPTTGAITAGPLALNTPILGRINAANMKRAHALLVCGKACGKLVLEAF